ncbi:MAG TPA: hypothetical protein VLB76_05300 [Thermoanaerobaculia bacterium]|nr:hypothetical protein [Thermoanaerobaculia bacterium]
MRISKAMAFLICLMFSAHMASAFCPMSPLVLDLNGDGVQTTDLFAPVSFDLNGDGVPDRTAWTCGWTEEGFLWLDLNRNGTVDGGRELFGQGTLLPSGESAANGFEALRVYDGLSYGGHTDGVISEDDLIWSHLLLWVDRNHDGISQRQEIASLRHFGIVAIGLDFSRVQEVDGNGNLHPLQSTYLKRLTVPRLGSRLVPYAVHDVFFKIGDD